MNISYLLPRVIRHFLPDSLTRTLLRHSWIIRPGLETSNPGQAVKRYRHALEANGGTLSGKRALVFGYGGSFAIGCGLLDAGAEQVTLSDRYAPPDDHYNAAIFPKYAHYLVQESGRIRPQTDRLLLSSADIREAAAQASFSPVDLVFSSSVYEHLDDVEGVTQALASLTDPAGWHIHFVDLRDHFFKYPFEMLCYSEKTWRNWLNPGSNHNRYRLGDYRRAFSTYFAAVEITILARDEAAFEQAQPRIRSEFLTGDSQVDSVTQIQVIARSPRQGGTGSIWGR